MNTLHSLHELAVCLERCADAVDDVANSDWIAIEELRERLFAIEARMWRLSRDIRKLPAEADAGRMLDARLLQLRQAVTLCLGDCTDDDGIAELETIAGELETARCAAADLAAVARDRVTYGAAS